MNAGRFLAAWGRMLVGKSPMLSIEITRECPLHCPGCYAYDDEHLGGGVTLRQLRDLRGNALVAGVLELVRLHDPIHLSIVGGEPLVRHRELSQILPALSARRVETLVVTSGVISIPADWNRLRHIRIAVSVDGLQPDHDLRRFPATYDRILNNISERRVDLSWVITGPQMERPGYLNEYLSYWTARPEIDRIWISLYTPQVGECSPQMLTSEQRLSLVAQLPELKKRYPALLMTPPASRRRWPRHRSIPITACFRGCRLTTRRTSPLVSIRVSLEGHRIVSNAAVQLLLAFTGLETGSCSVSFERHI